MHFPEGTCTASGEKGRTSSTSQGGSFQRCFNIIPFINLSVPGHSSSPRGVLTIKTTPHSSQELFLLFLIHSFNVCSSLRLFLQPLYKCLMSRRMMILLIHTGHQMQWQELMLSFQGQMRSLGCIISIFVHNVFNVIYPFFSWSASGSVNCSCFIIYICREFDVFHSHKIFKPLYLLCSILIDL